MPRQFSILTGECAKQANRHFREFENVSLENVRCLAYETSSKSIFKRVYQLCLSMLFMFCFFGTTMTAKGKVFIL